MIRKPGGFASPKRSVSKSTWFPLLKCTSSPRAPFESIVRGAASAAPFPSQSVTRTFSCCNLDASFIPPTRFTTSRTPPAPPPAPPAAPNDVPSSAAAGSSSTDADGDDGAVPAPPPAARKSAAFSASPSNRANARRTALGSNPIAANWSAASASSVEDGTSTVASSSPKMRARSPEDIGPPGSSPPATLWFRRCMNSA
eukprot:31434-Pelagococcus_subviridis.AAC.14